MAALPKKKRTQAKIGKRRSHFQPRPISLSTCPQCRTPKPSHRICPTCGYYAGREVLPIAHEERRQEV